MNLPKLRLISFKLCPFVQRTVITLLHKDVPYDIDYIDLNEPPEWFKELSPLGKVPVLQVDGKEVIFESAVIQEYVDEITPPPLQPEDPLVRAKNRAWISYGGEMIMKMHGMVTAKDAEAFNKASDEFAAMLARVNDVHSGGDYFNGDTFALIDAAYAPIFMRLNRLCQECGVTVLDLYPKLKRWSDNLLALPSVQHSVVEEFPMMYCKMLEKMDGYLATQLK